MNKKKNLILLGFVILKFIIQYCLISSNYDLHRDEFLHLDQANHLAWGYLSIPPFTSWISLLINLLGNTVFWIKFFPALFGALTIVVVWKATEELTGNVFALVLSATCVLFSALLRINMLLQPNSFDVLSWTTFYFILIKYFKTENSKWLYIAALVFSVGFLNKYNIIFLLIGLVPAILATKYRKAFIKKDLYFAMILSLVLVLPNLIWQYKNNFPVVHHLKELTDTQLVNVDRMDFLKSQILFFAGALFVIIFALYALLFYKPFKNYKAFFGAFIFTLMVFTWFRAKSYYAIGLYPIYISFGSVFLANVLKTGWKKYLQFVLIILPILFFNRMNKVSFPNKTPEYMVENHQQYQRLGMLRWEDGNDHLLPQDFADMLGWKELAATMDSICLELPNIDNTLILCDNYGEAGAINYYKKNKKIVACSFHADYINWLPLDRNITDVVLVKATGDKDIDREKATQLFDTVYLAGKRINQYAREDTIFIYVLRDTKTDIIKIIKDEINKH